MAVDIATKPRSPSHGPPKLNGLASKKWRGICSARRQFFEASPGVWLSAYEEDVMERRTFLPGDAAAAVGISSQPAASQSPPAAGQSLPPTDLQSAVARLGGQFLKEFDPAYVENVIVPWFLVSTYKGESLSLPMNGSNLTKENAWPYDLWGLLSESWSPCFSRLWRSVGRIIAAKGSTCLV
jgi:hypothetical protein